MFQLVSERVSDPNLKTIQLRITNGQIAASLLCGVSAIAVAGAAAMKSKSNNTSDITVPHTGMDSVIESSEHGYAQGMEEHNLGEIICDVMPLADEHNSATEAFSGSMATEQVSNTEEVKLPATRRRPRGRRK